MVSSWHQNAVRKLKSPEQLGHADAESIGDNLQGLQCHTLLTCFKPVKMRSIQARGFRELISPLPQAPIPLLQLSPSAPRPLGFLPLPPAFELPSAHCLAAPSARWLLRRPAHSRLSVLSSSGQRLYSFLRWSARSRSLHRPPRTHRLRFRPPIYVTIRWSPGSIFSRISRSWMRPFRTEPIKAKIACRRKLYSLEFCEVVGLEVMPWRYSR